MPKLSEPLMKLLRKGSFPLTSESGVALWRELLQALEKDFDGTMQQIEDATPDFSDICDSTLDVNGVQFDTGHSERQVYLGLMHERLSAKHDIASRPHIQTLIQRIRKLCTGHVAESKVILGMDPQLKMGNGLVSTALTFIPDPAWGVTFGSVPDQAVVGQQAPAWNLLKKRVYEDRGGNYGRKPHYVLAHLVNHNLNGPGNQALNVIPYWATANTDMAKKAEVHVKELVLRGVEVQYSITLGAAVGMTPGRKKAYDAASGDAKKIIELEQHLASSIIINCSAKNDTGAWVPIVVNLPIDNYVPETVPLI